jgi:pimeloyl-ACP methyl ester carboxylesterase
MTTFVLVPGAGGAGWYWHLVAERLEAAGHTAVAVDLPGADPAAGLREYADLVLVAADGRDAVVLVAQSMGAFTALAACERLDPQRLVLLNAMIPAPGETANAWWDNTGWERPASFTLETHFLHDVPPAIAAGLAEHEHDEADIGFEQPCEFDRWPDAPTTVLAGRDDRFFPPAFQRRVARERLGLDVVELPGGHLNALSQPKAVATAVADPAAGRRR